MHQLAEPGIDTMPGRKARKISDLSGLRLVSSERQEGELVRTTPRRKYSLASTAS